MVRRTFKWLWYSLAALIIGIAVLVSIGRLLLPQAYRLKPTFEQYLAQRTGAKVRVGEIRGVWRGFGPELRVRDIELLAPNTEEPLLTIARFEAALDIPRSVFSAHTVMRRFEVEGLKALVELDAKGSLVLPGLIIDSGIDSDISAQYVIDALLRQSRVSISQTEIRYRRRQGDVIPLVLPEISLRNGQGRHQAIGELRVHEGGAAKFVLEFTDYPLDSTDRMAVYLESQALELARLPLPTAALGVQIEDGDLQLQIWSNWRDGGWRDGQANLTLTQLQLVNEEQQRRGIEHVHGRLHFSRADNDVWYLHGDDVRWQLAGEQPPGKPQPALSIEGMVRRDGDDQRWGLDIGPLALADLAGVVRFSSIVPADVRSQLAELDPTAALPTIQLDFQLQNEVMQDWAVATRFEQLRYRSERLPQMAELSGRVLVGKVAGDATGAVRITATDQAIDFHQLFRAPLAVAALDVGARWQQREQDWLVTVPALQLSNADAQIEARASLTLPVSGAPELALAATLRNGVGASAAHYLPISVMKPELVTYLDGAIETATVTEAQSVLRGPLGAFPFRSLDGAFEVQAAVSDGRYRFLPEWPTVTELGASLAFNSDSMHIDVQRGALSGMRLSPSTVVLSPLAGADAMLTVQASGSGSGQAAQALVQHSPLRQPLSALTDTLEINGAITADLALAIPLQHSRDTSVKGKISFGNASVRLKSLELPLTAVRGAVEFAEFGVTAGDVRMQALGGTVHAAIQGDSAGGIIDISGNAEAADVAAWYPHPMQNNVAGTFDYTGRVALPGREQTDQGRPDREQPEPQQPDQRQPDQQQHGVRVELHTELQGVMVQAPAPLGKTADEAVPLHFVATINDGRLALRADYGAQVAFEAERTGTSRLNAELLLGATPYAGHSPGFGIRGQLGLIPAREWIPFVNDLVSTASNNENRATADPAVPKTATAMGAPSLALSIAELDFYGLPVTAVELAGRESETGYQLSVRSAAVIGEIEFAARQPIRITLEKFLHEAPVEAVMAEPAAISDPVVVETAEPPIPQREPGDAPELEVDCKQCRFYGRDFGRLQFSAINHNADKKLKLQADRKGLLTANLDGVWSAASHETQVSARIASPDWGKLTEDWGFDLSVRESPAKFDIDLRWPGSPLDFSLPGSHGTLKLDAGKGYIARESANAEKVLRVFSLLSLQSITRRLSLDFSDLFRDGFYYDSMRGSFAIEAGKATTHDTLIDGVSAAISIRGETDFVARTLNQKIDVAPKLSSSLPILAGWAINPPAGLVVWLMNKLFIESAVKVVTSLQYTVRGPWDNPEVIERGRTEKEVPIPEEGLPEPGAVPAVPPSTAKPETVTPVTFTTTIVQQRRAESV